MLLQLDIKPENLFVTRNGVVKIGDLGLCRNYEHSSAPSGLSFSTPITFREPAHLPTSAMPRTSASGLSVTGVAVTSLSSGNGVASSASLSFLAESITGSSMGFANRLMFPDAAPPGGDGSRATTTTTTDPPGLFPPLHPHLQLHTAAGHGSGNGHGQSAHPQPMPASTATASAGNGVVGGRFPGLFGAGHASQLQLPLFGFSSPEGLPPRMPTVAAADAGKHGDDLLDRSLDEVRDSVNEGLSQHCSDWGRDACRWVDIALSLPVYDVRSSRSPSLLGVRQCDAVAFAPSSLGVRQCDAVAFAPSLLCVRQRDVCRVGVSSCGRTVRRATAGTSRQSC